MELVKYCLTHAESIYVRAQIDGKWGSYKLSEIPVMQALAFMANWEKAGVIPVRLLSEEEREKD